MGAKGTFISHRDSFKFQIISKFLDGKLLRREVSELLGISERSVSRLATKVRDNGLIGVKHGNVGNKFSASVPVDFRSEALSLIKERYYDFNVTHIREMLTSKHGIDLSYRTLLRLCRENNLIKNPRRQRRNKRVYRRRMPSEGLLLQMDGSHHCWNQEEEWCLIAAIDDATSEIPYAEFFKSETTLGCLAVLKRIIELKGVPKAIYTDRAGWTGGRKRDNFAQFQRACDELCINLIIANSPEAKGRIERSFRTIQDRLIPEFRINNIKSMSDANSYLNKEFLAKYWNIRNTVAPVDTESGYRAVTELDDITNTLCIEEYRKINKDETVSWKGRRYLVKTKHSVALRGYSAVVRTYLDGTYKVFVMGREVKLEDINYNVQDPVDKPRVFNKVRFLYNRLYEEVHWLFDDVREAKVSGKPLKIRQKKKTG